MGEQIDTLEQNEKQSLRRTRLAGEGFQDARGGLDEAMRDRANIEKNCKMSQGLIVESNTKLDELARA